MSHKFTVEIELEDARYCDGCPLLNHEGFNCCAHFGISAPERYVEEDGALTELPLTFVITSDEWWAKYDPMRIHHIRPQRCIDAEKGGE